MFYQQSPDNRKYLPKACKYHESSRYNVSKAFVLNEYLNVGIHELSHLAVPGTDKPEGVTISLIYAPAK